MNVTPSSLGLELSHTSLRRGGFRLNHLKPKLEAMADNFCFMALREWDSLPNSCIKCISVAGFKSIFRKHVNNCI